MEQTLIDALMFDIGLVVILLNLIWKTRKHGKRIDELERKLKELGEKPKSDPDEFWRRYQETKPK